MTNPANDIVKQASQGSVAAIIQILNEKLADSKVRTRAMMNDKGVLQLLCEAATLEQLEATVLIDRIRQILESLAPRNIRRVNVNGRLVREQQLLWLDEIHRDPAAQLLWSQEITLKQPNLIERLQQEWQTRSDRSPMLSVRSPRKLREQRQFWRGGLIGGATVAALILIGWGLYSKFVFVPPAQTQAKATQALNPSADPVTAPASPIVRSPEQTASTPATPTTPADPFADAVRLAEQTAQAGKTARSPQEWQELAQRWQQASDLMASVPNTDGRYQTAQDRVNRYRENGKAALERADQAQ
jgi:hypothetical protein